MQETDQLGGMGFRESALALRAQSDERAREELITRQEKNILRIASRAKHRFVTKSDDEWSIALFAFSRAIDTYRAEKGAFLPYAEKLIRNSLIDSGRAEARRAREISVPPDAFEGEGEEESPEDGGDAETKEDSADDRADSTASLRDALKGAGRGSASPVDTYRAKQAEAWKRPLTATK